MYMSVREINYEAECNWHLPVLDQAGCGRSWGFTFKTQPPRLKCNKQENHTGDTLSVGAFPVSRATATVRSLLGPVDLSFRALSGRLKFTVRRHTFNKDHLSEHLGRVRTCGSRGWSELRLRSAAEASDIRTPGSCIQGYLAHKKLPPTLGP